MADGPGEDFSQLPFPDRFRHKDWKVRKEGYEAAAKEFEQVPDEADPAFEPFLQDPGLWKSVAGDSHVAAQQEGLTALCAFLKHGRPQAASRSRGLTIEPIREKGLSSTRPAVKAAALEAVFLYVEIDKPDLVIEELLPALSHKQPKIVAANLSAMAAVYHNFGCKIVDYKPVVKALPKVFGHADKNVRAEASNLTVELYRWLRDAMKVVFWDNLKPVQQQDLEKLFDRVKEEPFPRQERLTRAQQAAAAVIMDTGGQDEADGGLEDTEREEPIEVDTFDCAEPVDIFPLIAKDLRDNLVSSKWKERKDALDGLFGILNTPRIKDGPFDDIVRDLAKITLKDANVTVVATAANCVEKLAAGIRRGFAKHRSTIMSPMLERLKEKKQAVTDALGAALDAVFASTSLSDCLEEILSFLPHKNPQVRLETAKFLSRCLKNTRKVPSKTEVKAIADGATKLLTDSTELMRSGGAEILGTLMKILGERAMESYVDSLDDIRKTKIKEYFDTAVVKAKDRPKPVVASAKVAGPSAVGKKPAGTGAKKPPAVKRPASIITAPLQEDEYVPPKPKPTAKSLAKPTLSRPGSNLAASAGSKLGALKKPSSGVASPQRRVISPPTNPEDDEIPAPSPAKFGLGRNGLAGRPLSKPAPSYPEPTASSPSVSSGLSATERAELEELRAEKQRLTCLSDNLRSSHTKLTAEISELQDQNARLIEDHTRDVLQIKAKETQLVRARGECEDLRSEIETAKKDIERQKREMSRLGRESFGRDQQEGVMMNSSNSPGKEDGDDIYSDNLSNTAAAEESRPGSILGRTGSLMSDVTAPTSKLGRGSRPPNYPDRFEMNSPSEEKENTGDGGALFSPRLKLTSPVYGNGGSRAASPQRNDFMNGAGGKTGAARTTGGNGAQQQQQQHQQKSRERSPADQPAENWKRAAEVTSQLKARIEQMKARQGLLKS